MSDITDRSRDNRYWGTLVSSFFALGILLTCASGAVLANENAERYLERDSVREYIRELSAEHGLNVNRIAGLFSRLNRQQSILDAISKPAERTLSWRQYRSIFLTQKRIDGGKAFLREHNVALKQAQEQFGVPAEIIAAIIGVETQYGGDIGSYRVLEALATLAFDYPPRSDFFTSEMTEFVLLAEKEDWDTINIRGSYAGAMGMPQFIASSYRKYAVDFDSDGTRNLFTSHPDIIGSVANYLSVHGWRAGEPVAERWVPQWGIADPMLQLVREDLKPEINPETVRALGFAAEVSSSDTGENQLLSVMTLDGDGGQELWVGYRNFYAITRYNHSRLYAMAVFQLAEAIREASL